MTVEVGGRRTREVVEVRTTVEGTLAEAAAGTTSAEEMAVRNSSEEMAVRNSSEEMAVRNSSEVHRTWEKQMPLEKRMPQARHRVLDEPLERAGPLDRERVPVPVAALKCKQLPKRTILSL